jgi:hypothetical protein
MIEPLRYNLERAPAMPITRPVFCAYCLGKKQTRNNPSVAVKYCVDCFDRSKKFFCIRCDEEFHRVGPTKDHLRRLLVIGAGVRKQVLSRGDGIYFPMPMDQVRCKVQSRIYHEGKMIKKMDPTYIDFMSGLSGECVHVQVLGCKNITAADLHGSSDPYVVGMYQGKKLGLTRIRPRTLNPRWINETFVVPVADNLQDARNMPRSQKGLFRLELYDYDWIGANDFLGNVELTKPKLKMLAEISKQEPILLPLTMQEFHGLIGINIGLSNSLQHISVRITRAESLDKFNPFNDGRPFVKVYFGEEYLGKTPFCYDSGEVIWTKGHEFRLPVNDILKREKKILKHLDLLEEQEKRKFLAAIEEKRARLEKINKSKVDKKKNKKNENIEGEGEGQEGDNAEPTTVPDELIEDSKDDKLFRFDIYEFNYISAPGLLGRCYFPIHHLRKLCPNLPKQLVEVRVPTTSDKILDTQRNLLNYDGCIKTGGTIIIDDDDGDDEFWERKYPTKILQEGEEEEESDDEDPLMADMANRGSTNDTKQQSIEEANAMLEASAQAELSGLTEKNLTNPKRLKEDKDNAGGAGGAGDDEKVGLLAKGVDGDSIIEKFDDDLSIVGLGEGAFTVDGGSVVGGGGSVVIGNENGNSGSVAFEVGTSVVTFEGDTPVSEEKGEGAAEVAPVPSLDLPNTGSMELQDVHTNTATDDADGGEVEEKSDGGAKTVVKIMASSSRTNSKAPTPRFTPQGTPRSARPAPPPEEAKDGLDTNDTPYYWRSNVKDIPNDNIFGVSSVNDALDEMTEAVSRDMVKVYREQRLLKMSQPEVINGMFANDSLVGMGYELESEEAEAAAAQLAAEQWDPVQDNPELLDVPTFEEESPLLSVSAGILNATQQAAADAEAAANQPPLTKKEMKALEKKNKEEAKRVAKEEKARLKEEEKEKRRRRLAGEPDPDEIPELEPEPEPEIDPDEMIYHKIRHYNVERESDKNDFGEEAAEGNLDLGHIIVRLIPAKRGNIIAGLDEGVRHMSLGETANIKVRFDHGYNNYMMSEYIPARANMIFTVTLKSINGFGLLGLPLRTAKRIYRFTTYACRITNNFITETRRDWKKKKRILRAIHWFKNLFNTKEIVQEEEEDDELDMQVQEWEEDEESEFDEEEEYNRHRRIEEDDGNTAKYMKKHVSKSTTAGVNYLWSFKKKPGLTKRKKGKKGDNNLLQDVEEGDEENSDVDEESELINSSTIEPPKDAPKLNNDDDTKSVVSEDIVSIASRSSNLEQKPISPFDNGAENMPPAPKGNVYSNKSRSKKQPGPPSKK